MGAAHSASVYSMHDLVAVVIATWTSSSAVGVSQGGLGAGGGELSSPPVPVLPFCVRSSAPHLFPLRLGYICLIILSSVLRCSQGSSEEFELSPLLKTLKVDLLSHHVPTKMVSPRVEFPFLCLFYR